MADAADRGAGSTARRAPRGRASRSHRADRRSRPDRRRDVLRRRRRICLRPRGSRFRRYGPPARPRAARRLDAAASLAAVAGGRMHPRHGARRVRIQRAAFRQYQLHTNPGAFLPRRNLQVLQPPYVCEETIDPDKLAAAIRGHFTAFDLSRGAEPRSRWRCAGRAAVPRADRRVRHGHQKRAAEHASREGEPLYIMLDGDIAQTLGAILREELDVKARLLVHRRRDAVGLRLHRSRPHPHAVL